MMTMTNWTAAAALALACGAAQATHPLVTEDTGTQGEAGNQLELNTDWQIEGDTRTQVATMAYTRGLTDALDVFVSAPHTMSSPSGMNDSSLGIKWRFYDENGLSLGVKPEYLMASGDAGKGLGNGRDGMALTLMLQYEAGNWIWLANVAATRNRYSDATLAADNREWVGRESLALIYKATEQLSLLIDVGQSDHREKAQSQRPQYAVLGMIYSPRAGLDLDIGYKAGLNSTETDRQIGVGVTWRFK
jgi:hypothetical protein